MDNYEDEHKAMVERLRSNLNDTLAENYIGYRTFQDEQVHRWSSDLGMWVPEDKWDERHCKWWV